MWTTNTKNGPFYQAPILIAVQILWIRYTNTHSSCKSGKWCQPSWIQYGDPLEFDGHDICRFGQKSIILWFTGRARSQIHLQSTSCYVRPKKPYCIRKRIKHSKRKYSSILVPPTTVTVSPTVAVVAGQPVTLTCTVNNDVTLPVTFKWQRVQGTSRVDPPQAAVSATTGKSSTLTWTGIPSQDGGQYECLATNEAGSKTSSPVTVTVYCK